MAMTTGQLNIWRYCVREATLEAAAQRIPFSRLIRMEWKKYGYIPVSAYNAD